ncbi:MAG: hypothetical protein ABSD70_04510 [Terracidiphilus sp.]|jgi:hypothetical protein
MGELGQGWANPELKAIVAEASRALAALDALRLEELALSCQALNRSMAADHDSDWREEMARQAREAAADMAVFGRVLEATRANLHVMNRLREMRLGQLEYKARSGAADWTEPQAGNGNGNH